MAHKHPYSKTNDPCFLELQVEKSCSPSGERVLLRGQHNFPIRPRRGCQLSLCDLKVYLNITSKIILATTVQ